MHFRTLAMAAILANFCVYGPAQAGSLFNTNNSSSSNEGGAAAPVFIQTPQQAPAQPVSSNLYTNAGENKDAPPMKTPPRTMPMTDQEYARAIADNDRQNAAVGAQRTAAVNANFNQVAQQNAQMRAAEKAQAAAGGGKGQVAQPPVDPYAGHTVVFTGGQKADGDKPPRLFNVQ